MELAGIEMGEAEGSPFSIVFIHGWLDNAASFQVLLSKLHNSLPDVHLYAPDLPGHGLSKHKGEYYFYPFHDYLDDIHQVISALPTKSCVLVGHSLGGLIASCYSAAFPEKVSALVQIEGKGPLSELPELSLKRLRNGLENRERMRKKKRKGYPTYQSALAHKSKRAKLPESLVEPIVQRGIEELDGHWFWRADTKLSCQSLFRMSHEQAQEIVNHILCPYHIVLGHDGFEHLRNNGNVILPAQSVIHTVRGGHYCHLESPDAIKQIILNVVKDVRSE
ncbi:alpha/beta fold hydrolase [Vibrio salinus]|uniref:alpha/beta fold hydrolase n=1 Tax=Vibrio salinus TaxID=2899784 RepID=UPI001E459184|nr:alpha/beta hydrolase [Vibrio salinus]MCE0492910.1 alpha/beta hydrolase [Vibrio salinus]